jgi:hypothetical protein
MLIGLETFNSTKCSRRSSTKGIPIGAERRRYIHMNLPAVISPPASPTWSLSENDLLAAILRRISRSHPARHHVSGSSTL